ncbi:MAG TPA: GNAT family N-acyltransferase [Albidovulum sp.]|uniref:GNAT family N-acetyltransferase n=1 Tax=Albidovulum sp. TaxID=1872424 RepID=UPI002C0A8E90|nr:GNAT family N-acyltransferase [Albidovulum sp.]
MPELKRGRYSVRFASSAEDVARAQALRGQAFRGAGRSDADAYDAFCRHLLIEAAGALVAALRLRVFRSGVDVNLSYAAQYYDLSSLYAFPAAMVELGRFCLHPDRHDPDILRLAWGAITSCVDRERAGMLFGCVSFRGTDPSAYPDAFAALRAGHLGPGRWLPGTKARSVIRFGQGPEARPADPKAALLQMPPLLRSYLAMGGWVSDHAVVDAELDTMHVFTALEVDRVPAARARSLRLIAG